MYQPVLDDRDSDTPVVELPAGVRRMGWLGTSIRYWYSMIFTGRSYRKLDSRRCMASASGDEDACFGRYQDWRVEAQVVEEYKDNAEAI